jgi:hypothetical protein
MTDRGGRILKLEKAIDEAVTRRPGDPVGDRSTAGAARGSANDSDYDRLRTWLGVPFPKSTSTDGVQRPGGARTHHRESCAAWRDHQTGSHSRRVRVEAAWAYQHRPNVTGFLLRRQKNLALSDEVK